MVYVANYADNTVSVIDGNSKANSTAARATLPAGINPYAIAVTSNTNKVYVTNQAYNTVIVLNKTK